MLNTRRPSYSPRFLHFQYCCLRNLQGGACTKKGSYTSGHSLEDIASRGASAQQKIFGVPRFRGTYVRRAERWRRRTMEV